MCCSWREKEMFRVSITVLILQYVLRQACSVDIRCFDYGVHKLPVSCQIDEMTPKAMLAVNPEKRSGRVLM
jgi:hypothetical protein